MFGLGWPELLIIAFILLMVFGVGKLPEVGKVLGSGVKNFRDGLEGNDDEESSADEEDKPELLEEEKSVEAPTGEKTRQAERTESY